MTAPVPDHAMIDPARARELLSKSPDPYEGMDALDAWRSWFRESGLAEAWSKVECIECELGRHCLRQPPCAGARAEDD